MVCHKCYRKRLNSFLTLYLSSDGDNLVGCKIKGVEWIRKTIKNLELNEILIDDDSPFTVYVYYALAPTPSGPDLERYEIELRKLKNVRIKEEDFASINA